VAQFNNCLASDIAQDAFVVVITKALDGEINTPDAISEHGLILNEGTIVDASIISAPRSTKNEKRERDPEIKQTKKGNQWHFGMKTHIGTDLNGRIHIVVVTGASVHNSVVMDDLLHGMRMKFTEIKPTPMMRSANRPKKMVWPGV